MATAWTKTPQCIYDAIAHLRWPGYEITGSGSIAVVLICARKVFLTDWPLEAEVKCSEKCCAGCNHAEHNGHYMEQLNVPVPVPRINIRNRSLLERD